uniref:UTP--glucose-1-phosphate uridylyltransferase-like isoform X1 n=1 Tax=Styela clava TaxID=7725 RepID=UPI00193A8EE4|nr:UTP--glucose-1-phosphate uridylyltransferase-like isoform X1 [Styela clava]XP_039274753.1 UTP--glucose-1-phosphate uridylyltransferase-like isoform X1 [Styela clava]
MPNYGTSIMRTPSMLEFQQMMKIEAQTALKNELDRLVMTGSPLEREKLRKQYEGFQHLYKTFLEKTGPSVVWDKIKPPPVGSIHKYNEIAKTPMKSSESDLLSKLVVVKLNGGLGTSMGCTGPKSLISVRSGLTFLDLTVQQIESLNKQYNADVPLVLMNSFNTNEDTEMILRKYASCKVRIHTFEQNRYPRINKETLLPVPQRLDGEHEGWYPPGHGDIYECIHESGLLQKFIDQGREYMFVSNIDNLGADVDLHILDMLINPPNCQTHDFIMEVTDKTRADVKGGTLIQYEDKLRLLEIAQVPKEHVDEFKSVSKFKIFNTNNLWMKLSSIKELVENKNMDIEVIVNNKRLSSGTNVIQLETACGAGIKNFQNAIGINVPRSRFLPVKKTSDLLLVMSNLYELKHGKMFMSEDRMFKTTPLVKLGDEHFSKVHKYLSRFEAIPDMLELDHLTVSGDVTFGKDVTLKGTVIIIANHGERIDIPSGAILENKIVSGNLRILDH